MKRPSALSDRSVINVSKTHLLAFLRDHGVHLPVAAAISQLYQTHPQLLPHSSEWPRLAVLVVRLLAGYRMPDRLQAQPEQMGQFFMEVAEVSRILPLVWGRSHATDGVEECLKAFYVTISTEDSYSKPSCALASAITHIPRPFLDLSTKTILEESGQQQGEAKCVVGLQTMIEWLTQRPFPDGVLPEWVQNMLRGLQANDKNSILIEIAHSCTDKVGYCTFLQWMESH